MKPVLEYRDFSVSIDKQAILNGFNLSLYPGQITGLVGRSGAGKSMSALCALGVYPPSAKLSGSIQLSGTELNGADEKTLTALRGQLYSMIFQDPMSALNPLQTIEHQIVEALKVHSDRNNTEAKQEARSLLERVGLPANDISPRRYPHELSGGQRQRVAIAIAIANNPSVIFADEPTTALDITSQTAILTLLKSLCIEHNIALMFITHDLAVLSEIADHIAILRDGKVVASAAPDQLPPDEKELLFGHMKASLLQSVSPTANTNPQKTVLEVRNVFTRFDKKSRKPKIGQHAGHGLKDISFTLEQGENIAIVGESGSGKSTLARLLLAIHPKDLGTMSVGGREIDFTNPADLKYLWQSVQIVFQDPYSSFNPRKQIADIIAEPLHLLDHPPEGDKKDALITKTLKEVGLDPAIRTRFAHALSGGQRQRVAIARALVINPSILVLDEATSALDVATRSDILSLLVELQENHGLALIFISHDLSLVRQICQRTIVLKEGMIVETGETKTLMDAPEKPYTKTLVDAAKRLEAALHKTQNAPSRPEL